MKKEFNPTEQDLIDLESTIARLCDQRSELTGKKRRDEVKIANLNRRVQSAGQRLPQREYKDICNKQARLRNAIIGYEDELREINKSLRRKAILEKEIKLYLQSSSEESHDLLMFVKSLKAKYMAFASDQTRVSSMRSMASMFVEELDNAIRMANA